MKVTDSTVSEVSYIVDQYPNLCPICHITNIPKFEFGFINSHIKNFDYDIQAVFLCSNENCRRLFIAIYEPGNLLKPPTPFQEPAPKFELKKVEPVYPEALNINKTIEEISGNFGKIYNQSYFAEQMGLTLIAGTGYRKSLEFLIKDYLIYLKPEKEDEIKTTFLGKCIHDYVDNHNIKQVAKRAVWLGNDETHYDKVWKDKDVYDLKTLIELTVKWIEMEETTKNAIKEMPEKK